MNRVIVWGVSFTPFVLIAIVAFLMLSTFGYAAPVETAIAVSPQVVVTPVRSDAITAGTIGWAVLNWVLAFFSPVLGMIAVAVAAKIYQYFGLTLDAKRRQQLQDHVVNGLSYAATHMPAHIPAGLVSGMADPQFRSKLQQEVLRYVVDHAGPLLKTMGLSPDNPLLMESIHARIEKALNDPLVPTPPQYTAEAVRDATRYRDVETPQGSTGVEVKTT